MGWGGECVTPVLVRSLKSTASNWIDVQTDVQGFDSLTPHKPVFPKHLKQTSGYEVMTPWRMWGKRGSERVHAFYSTRNKLKGDWSKWIMMKTGMVDKQGESMVASCRYLRVSNLGLQMLGSNECDVSFQYGTGASFQHIRRLPPLYILWPKKNLRQLDSCQPSSQYEWSMVVWMCCQITSLVDQ